MSNGFFIVFEGGEGSGKTTAIEKVEKWLSQEQGYDVIVTREPGGIKISESIRNIILDKNNTLMDPKTEALLYAAARRQHLVEKIIPALKMGKIVLCDRFIDSSLAYQGFARNIGIAEVYNINKFAIGSFMPDISILFDIDPKEGLSRIKSNSEREVNRLDLEKIEFHKKVRQGYDIIYQNNKDRMVKIDASKSPLEIVSEIKGIIESKLFKDRK
ncbi:dTMP kinase [Clostridium sp. BJN0001]|uniref:dTMP kinase n=1 Tax=Clostridium sp. BJN0001 TaxID=2930219 RepID=UPI001FD2839C|nr:dTMP kinase [Clostridium sp. BJN0001]